MADQTDTYMYLYFEYHEKTSVHVGVPVFLLFLGWCDSPLQGYIPGFNMPLQGRMGGAVERGVASHQCVPGSIPASVMWVKLVVISCLPPRVFLPPEKPAFANSSSTRIEGTCENQLWLMWLPRSLNVIIILTHLHLQFTRGCRQAL